jgi:hypothetical protein
MVLLPRILVVVVLVGTVSVAPAQRADGTVCGFDDQPVAAAVRALDAKGQLLDETLADERGAFALQCNAPIAKLAAQVDAVIVELPIAGGAARDVAITFAGVAHGTVRGRALDPGGAPAAARDVLFRDGKGKQVATATTDADGAFSLRANVPLHDAVLDPLGWRHVATGPFAPDRDTTIDLRDHRATFFRLHGRVLHDAGRPAGGWRIRAHGERAGAAATTTAADGSFTLWCNQPIASLEAHDTVPRLGRLGPWTADTALTLDERSDALATVCGRFVDRDGTPIRGAMLIPSPRDAAPPKGTAAVGATDRDGRFAVRLVRGTPFLFAVDRSEKHEAIGRVPADGTPLLLRAR